LIARKATTMGWIQAGMFKGDEEEKRNRFVSSLKASCRNARVKVGEEVFDGLDVVRGVRYVKAYGESWERKSGIVVIDGQEFPVWQDEKWSHWELDPDGMKTREMDAKSNFRYKI
jgi:hypothetical protein